MTFKNKGIQFNLRDSLSSFILWVGTIGTLFCLEYVIQISE